MAFAETYSEAINIAIANATNPTSEWLPDSSTKGPIIIVPDTTADDKYGLKYDGTKLIVRTASKQKYWSSTSNKSTGQDYNIVGNISTGAAAWVTTGNDMTNFLVTNKGDLTGADITKLIERGLGMDDDGSHDAVLEYAVGAPAGGFLNDNLIRPTKHVDITAYSTTTPADYKDSRAFFAKPDNMSQTAYDDFTETFYPTFRNNCYIVKDKLFPFTQLGYTYFWGNGGQTLPQIQGMTEFVILPYADGKNYGTVTVYGIYPTQAYAYTRNNGINLSSAAGSQYGNGFASFQVDGSCDSVWAGHRFQSKVKKVADGTNYVKVTNTGSIKGGQGILIYSLNYEVENKGEISGSTSNKWAYSDTSDVAILFKGITDAASGSTVPVPDTGNNTVSNYGTLSSPGIAIEAEKGKTNITNYTGGKIAGGTYAIKTSTVETSDDAIIINGGEITGSIDLGAGADSLTVTAASNAKFNFVLNKDNATSGQIVSVETVNIADYTTLALTTTGTINVKDNESFLIVNSANLTVIPGNLIIQNDSSLPMVSFGAQKSGNNLSLVASRNNSYYGQQCGNSSLGTTLDSLANTSTGDMAAAIGALDGSGSAGNARQLEPTTDNSAPQTNYATMAQFINNILSRFDNVAQIQTRGSASAITDATLDTTGIWAQGFDTYLHQDPRGSSNGYNANVWGASLGFDTPLLTNSIVGISGGYARDDVRTKDNSARSGIDSYATSLYGSYAKNAYYLDLIASFAYNVYNSSRHIAFGGIDRTPTADYEGQQYSGYTEGGYTFKNKNVTITPLASLQYSHLHINNYTEENADSLNLNVAGQDYDALQSGLGAKLAYKIAYKECAIIPDLHFKWLYDFIGERQQSTSTFTGGGASFATNGFDPARSSYNFGTKLIIMTKKNVTLTANYDFELKEDFYSHAGYLNVRYDF